MPIHVNEKNARKTTHAPPYAFARLERSHSKGLKRRLWIRKNAPNAENVSDIARWALLKRKNSFEIA